MAFSSAVVRTTFIPLTGLSLSVGSMVLSEGLAELLAIPDFADGSKIIETELLEVSARALSIPRNRFVTFSA
jgi:hypothetical protein